MISTLTPWPPRKARIALSPECCHLNFIVDIVLALLLSVILNGELNVDKTSSPDHIFSINYSLPSIGSLQLSPVLRRLGIEIVVQYVCTVVYQN